MSTITLSTGMNRIIAPQSFRWAENHENQDLPTSQSTERQSLPASFDENGNPVFFLRTLGQALPLEKGIKDKLEKSIQALETLIKIGEEQAALAENIKQAQAKAKELRLKQIKQLLESLRLLISAADPKTAKRLAMRASALAKEAAKLVSDLKTLGITGVEASLNIAPTPQSTIYQGLEPSHQAERQGDAKAVRIAIPTGKIDPHSASKNNDTALVQIIQEINKELNLIAAIVRLKLRQEERHNEEMELHLEVRQACTALSQAMEPVNAYNGLTQATSEAWGV